MYQGNVCRLCVEICEDYKSLYDESDNATEVHQLMIQYFDAKLFAGNNFNVMCIKCWHQISDFNSFQQSVYGAQKILNNKDEEIDIKLEEEFITENNIASNYNEQSNDCNNFAGEIVCSSSADSYKRDDNIELDEPVGVSFGGEFGNGNSPTVSAALNEESNEPLKIKKMPQFSIADKLLAVEASDELIAQWTPVLKCLYCTEAPATYSLLENHFQDKHPLFQCLVKCCGKYFSLREKYEDHIRRQHIDSNPFACTVCGKQMECRRTLAVHIEVHHATANPKDVSNIAIALSSENVTEMSMKSVPQVFGEYNLHRPNYMKETDDFIAKMKPSLKCELCHEEYSTYSLLQQHFTESHPKNKCYITCCEKKFSARCHVVDHYQFHANPDVYKCEFCGRRLGTRYQLRAHLNKRHSTPIDETTIVSAKRNVPATSDELVAKWLPNIECSACKKPFAALTMLQCHFLACHPNDEFHVECCQRKLRTRHEIEAHVRYHVEPTELKCDLCCVCYLHETTLEEHMTIAH